MKDYRCSGTMKSFSINIYSIKKYLKDWGSH